MYNDLAFVAWQLQIKKNGERDFRATFRATQLCYKCMFDICNNSYALQTQSIAETDNSGITKILTSAVEIGFIVHSA